MKINHRAIAIIVLPVLLVACGRMEMDDAAHVQRARQYMQQDKHKAAIIELKNALQKNPDNRSARLLLGREYLLHGDGASAEKELRKAVDLGAGEEARLGLARAMLLAGRYQALIDEFAPREGEGNHARQGKDGNAAYSAELLVVLGDAALQLGDVPTARGYYEKAVALAPKAYPVLVSLARMSLHEHEDGKAADYLEQALKANPEMPEAWNMKGYLHFKAGEYEKALAAFSEAVSRMDRKPLNPEVFRSRIGVIQAELALRRYDAARKDIEALMKRVPRHPLPKYYHALLAFQEGDYDTAHDDLQDIVAHEEGGLPAVLLYGAVNYAKGNFAQAVMYLERFLDKIPSHLPARKMLAAAYLRQNRPDKAEEVLEPAMSSAADDAAVLSLVGKAAVLGGDLEKGERYLKSAVKADPEDPALREDLARLYLSSGKYDQAIAELKGVGGDQALRARVMTIIAHLRKKEVDKAVALAEQLVAESPDNPDLHFLLGRIQFLAGMRDKARSHFLEAVRIRPGHVSASLTLARLAMIRRNWAEAEEYLQQILKHDARNTSAMLALAQLAFAEGKAPEATAWIEKAKETGKKSIRPYLMLARYYLNQKQAQKALQEMDAVPDEFADSPLVMDLKGKAQFMLGRLEASLATYREAVQKSPDAPGLLFELAGVQQALHDYAAADKTLKRLLALAPDHLQAKTARVQVALQMGDARKALKLAQEIRKQYSSSPLGWVLEGDVHVRSGAYGQAQDSYRHALRIREAGPIVVKLAQAQVLAGQRKQAIRGLKEWVDAHPQDHRARMQLAMLYQQAGQADDAVAQYEAIVDQQQNNYVALNNLAILTMGSDMARARQYAERAYKLVPDNAAVMDTLGWILVKEGRDVQKGVQLLRKASGLAAGEPEIRYHLAAGLAASGQPGEAREMLDKLLADDEDFEDRDAASRLRASLK